MKLLLGLVVLVLLVVGGMKLLGGNVPEETAEASGGREAAPARVAGDQGGEDRASHMTFTEGSRPLGVLMLGEDDVLIRRGWLDDEGRGFFSTDTGTTGMTARDLFPDDFIRVTGGGTAEAKDIAQAAGGDEEPIYAERDFDSVGIGLVGEGGDLQQVRDLGKATVRAMGIGLNDLVINAGQRLALLGGAGVGKALLMHPEVTLSEPDGGDATITGQTDIGGLIDYLRDLDAAGRLAAGAASGSLSASGIDVMVFGSAGAEEPVVLVQTGVVGQFLVRRPGQDPLPLREVVMTNPIARGDYVTVELSTGKSGGN